MSVGDDYLKAASSPADERPSGITVTAADIQPESVSWLWEDRIPLAMPTVIGGFPGVGKSTINYDIAARVSREGNDVVIATAEDHLAAVAWPRLVAAEADLARVHFVTAPLSLPEGIDVLRKAVQQHNAVLLILDPLVAFIGESVNTHRDHHVRRVLAPLADLAEDTGAAVLVVIHTNKDAGTEPLMRISGSIGFTGAARAVLLAAEDPQDETRRILAVVKNNLAAFPNPLAYRIVGAEVEGIKTSRIDWLGDAPEVDPRELLMSRTPDERNDREEAIDFLNREKLLEKARPASELIREGWESQEIHKKTLQRARRLLGIPVWKQGFPAVTYWGVEASDESGQEEAPQSGQPHLVHSVHSEADQRKQAPPTPRVDTVSVAGNGAQPGSEDVAAVAKLLNWPTVDLSDYRRLKGPVLWQRFLATADSDELAEAYRGLEALE